MVQSVTVLNGSAQLLVALDRGVHSFSNYLIQPKMAQEKKTALHLNNGKEAAKTEKPKSTVKLVPPDGGWGWVIILATSICLVSYYYLIGLFKS